MQSQDISIRQIIEELCFKMDMVASLFMFESDIGIMNFSPFAGFVQKLPLSPCQVSLQYKQEE